MVQLHEHLQVEIHSIRVRVSSSLKDWEKDNSKQHEPMKFGSAGNSDVSQRQAKTINKTIDFPE